MIEGLENISPINNWKRRQDMLKEMRKIAQEVQKLSHRENDDEEVGEDLENSMKEDSILQQFNQSNG